MHSWGDEWDQKYGKDLDAAIREIMYIWITWGRIGTHGKEKYGTFRDHARFYTAWWPVHELVKPGHVYYRWPRVFMHLEIWLGEYIIKPLRLYKPIQQWQILVYNYGIQKVCKKYPHLVDELVSHIDGYEFVKPGIFGNVDGTVIHKKYWTET
jgi:hypothetical protein